MLYIQEKNNVDCKSDVDALNPEGHVPSYLHIPPNHGINLGNMLVSMYPQDVDHDMVQLLVRCENSIFLSAQACIRKL